MTTAHITHTTRTTHTPHRAHMASNSQPCTTVSDVRGVSARPTRTRSKPREGVSKRAANPSFAVLMSGIGTTAYVRKEVVWAEELPRIRSTVRSYP